MSYIGSQLTYFTHVRKSRTFLQLRDVYDMNVSLVKEQTVRNYAIKHAGARASCEDFISRIKAADWEKPDDMKATFGSVDILGKGTYRAVFDIG